MSLDPRIGAVQGKTDPEVVVAELRTTWTTASCNRRNDTRTYRGGRVVYMMDMVMMLVVDVCILSPLLAQGLTKREQVRSIAYRHLGAIVSKHNC